MEKALAEDKFTKDELTSWIKRVGGIGARIAIPKDAYHISSIKQLVIPYSGHPTGKLGAILGIVDNGGYPMISFAVGSKESWCALWHGMRIKSTNSGVAWHNNKTKKFWKKHDELLKVYKMYMPQRHLGPNKNVIAELENISFAAYQAAKELKKILAE